MCQHRPYLYTNTHSRRAKLLQKLRRILVNSHSFNKLGPEKFLSRTISPRSVLEGSLNGKSTFLVGTYTPRLSWVVLTTFFATAAVFNSALCARYPTYFIWVWCCLVCYLLFHLKVTLIQCSVHRSRTKPTSLTDDCWAGLGWEPQNPFFAEAHQESEQPPSSIPSQTRTRGASRSGWLDGLGRTDESLCQTKPRQAS